MIDWSLRNKGVHGPFGNIEIYGPVRILVVFKLYAYGFYKVWILDAKFNAYSEFEVKKLCLPTHFRENRFFKFAWTNPNKFMCIESKLKFLFKICACVDTCLISKSRIAKVQKNVFSFWEIFMTSYDPHYHPQSYGRCSTMVYQPD